MKVLIAISLLLASSTTFACVDLSGDYQTDEQTYYSITQHGCESMDVSDETGSSNMKFDGVEALTYDYDLEVSGAVLAHVSTYLSSKIDDDKWIYNERDVVTYVDGKVDEEKKWAEVSFNEDKNLQTILHNADGSTETFIDIRNKK